MATGPSLAILLTFALSSIQFAAAEALNEGNQIEAVPVTVSTNGKEVPVSTDMTAANIHFVLQSRGATRTQGIVFGEAGQATIATIMTASNMWGVFERSGMSLGIDGSVTSPLKIRKYAFVVRKIVLGSGREHDYSINDDDLYYRGVGASLTHPPSPPQNRISGSVDVSAMVPVRSVQTIQGEIRFQVAGGALRQITLAPASDYIARRIYISNLTDTAWVKVTAFDSSHVEIAFSESAEPLFKDALFTTASGKVLKSRERWQHQLRRYTFYISDLPKNGRIELRFWSGLKTITKPFTIRNIQLSPALTSEQSRSQRPNADVTVNAWPVPDAPEARKALIDGDTPTGPAPKLPAPITLARLNMSFQLVLAKQVEQLRFNKNGQPTGMARSNITIQLKNQHNNDLKIKDNDNYLMDIDPIRTDSGQLLFFPAPDGPQNAFRPLTLPITEPVHSLVKIHGRIHMKIVSARRWTVLLSPIKKYLDKRVRIANLGKYVWIRVHRGHDAQGETLWIALSDEAHRKLAYHIRFYTHAGQWLKAGWGSGYSVKMSDDGSDLGYHVKLPDDGKMFISFWPRIKTMIVPFTVGPVHLIGSGTTSKTADAGNHPGR